MIIDFTRTKSETPGWNDEVLMWCRNAAQENGLKPGDYMGGFAIN